VEGKVVEERGQGGSVVRARSPPVPAPALRVPPAHPHAAPRAVLCLCGT